MAQEPRTIREEIAGTRDELAETVQGLVEKADVKRRVKESVRDGGAQLQQKAGDVGQRAREVAPEKAKAGASLVQDRVQRQPWVLAVVGGVIAMGVLAAARRRRNQ